MSRLASCCHHPHLLNLQLTRSGMHQSFGRITPFQQSCSKSGTVCICTQLQLVPKKNRCLIHHHCVLDCIRQNTYSSQARRRSHQSFASIMIFCIKAWTRVRTLPFVTLLKCFLQRFHSCWGDRISFGFHQRVRERADDAHEDSKAEAEFLITCIVSVERRRLAQASQVLEHRQQEVSSMWSLSCFSENLRFQQTGSATMYEFKMTV